MSDTPKADIRALAKLARLELSDAEVSKLEGELPAILGFVDEIQKVSADMPKAVSPKHRNVMRADSDPHESGAFTEALLAAAPNRIGNQVAVKQVVSRNRASHK
jgi:aspartyl-tRNA(Asn)/glutamyl-tRNA(Gln) amidotransferase subunit C